MADLSVTAASCVPTGNTTIDNATVAGETIAAGKAVYLSATNKWMLADNDSATALAKAATGISLSGASLNQPIHVAKKGDITLGATLTPGTVYFLSATAGGICPVADLASGKDVSVIGVAKSASLLMLIFANPGVTL